ncbi:cardiolipin synthase [Paenibacillus koleovorans]|uniref:cardiolipin synthase n=1 Tax=Paenibacillus koleovorans TaxID=121608 RepID=UPI000FDA537B|nr:cardiolipin synthase [Paenibacillus koleovorans]
MFLFQQDISTYILAVNILLALTVVFLERRNVAATWSWLMVLLFIPILGFVLYIILGQNLSRRKLYKLSKREAEIRQTLTQAQARRIQEDQMEYKDPEMRQYKDTIYMNVVANQALLTQNNGIEIFTEGRTKFEALLQSIREAKHHIHLQYYIINRDELAAEVLEALTERAQAGVEVRILYDDIGSRRLNDRFFRTYTMAGGQKAAFFPSRIPYFNLRVNYRNHRKIVVIDGKVGFLGGFNIGNEYMGRSKRFGFWRDTHLRLGGSSVHALQRLFLRDWNVASENPVELDRVYYPQWEPHTGAGDVPMQIVASGPNQKWSHIENTYIKMINAAKKSIYLQTPYFIPDESLQNALRIAALSGVDVRVMIPNDSDHLFVHWASLYYVGELLEAGVKCYLYRKGFLHAKTMTVDGLMSTVGTANFDLRSLRLNFEANAVIYHAGTSRELHAIFERDMQDCKELTREEYDNRSLWHRLMESISNLLSPIL